MGGVRLSIRHLDKIYGSRSGEGDLRDDVNRVLGTWWGKPSPPVAARSSHVLRDICFEVAAGEAVCVTGANGAGKSTLLRLIAGISRPSGGEIAIRGRVAPLIELGAGFHRELTGEENARLFAAVLGLSLAEIRATLPAIFELSALQQERQRLLKHYSSGMRTRLALSVALRVNADILLLDEVMATLDAQFRAICIAELARQRARGVAVVLVSHDTQLLAAVCDRAVRLDAGRLTFDGPVREAFAPCA